MFRLIALNSKLKTIVKGKLSFPRRVLHSFSDGEKRESSSDKPCTARSSGTGSFTLVELLPPTPRLQRTSIVSFTLVELLIVTPLRFLRKLRKGTVGIHSTSSFTLVELLIVIGILAILTAAVVITLNPAERLRESRDSQRIQELTSLEQTINLLLTQVPNLSMGTASTVYISIPDSSATCANLGLPTLPTGYTYSCKTAANYRKTDGTGWIPVNFQSGLVASLPTLPVDPTNTTSTGLYYTYMMGGSFELTGLMEASKENSAARDDGGMLPGVIQKGTHKDLTPATRDKGLVGYWTFDEGSGTTARDYSGKNSSGTLTNGPTWQTESNCVEGGCLSFDGTNDYISVNGAASYVSGTPKFSISLWVKFNNFGNDYPQLFKAISNNISFHAMGPAYGANQGKVTAYTNGNIHAGGWCAVYTAILSPATWYHLTTVYDGSRNIMYMNGSQVSSNACGVTENISTISTISFGSNSTGDLAHSLNGLLDDFRVYNRALSATEIKAIYDATK